MILRFKVPGLNGKSHRVSFTYVKTLILTTMGLFCVPIFYFQSIVCHQNPIKAVCHQVDIGVAIGKNDSHLLKGMKYFKINIFRQHVPRAM